MSEHVYAVTRADFTERVLEASRERPVLVDFWAEWCAPCKALMPMLEKLAAEYAGAFALAKANADEQQELAADYGVRSLPTVLVFRNGEPVDGFGGLQPESALRELIERHRVREADRLVAQALEAEPEQALELLRQAHAADPDHVPARLELARRLGRAGELEPARQLLTELPVADRESEAARTLEAELNLLAAQAAAPPVEALEGRLSQDPADAEASYLLALRRYQAGQVEPALEGLLELMLTQRDWREQARHRLLEIFQLRGDDDPLVKRYRRRLAMAMH